MSFRGSIPPNVATLICEISDRWESTHVYVGCAGNFTIQRALRIARPDRDWYFYANDVTLYSAALGAFFSGKKIRLQLRPDQPFKWLAKYEKDSMLRMTTLVMLSSHLTPMINSKGEPKDVPYYERMEIAVKRQFPILVKRTEEILEKNMFELEPTQRDSFNFLEDYNSGDVVEWFSTVPEDAPFIVYPPFSGIEAYEHWENESSKMTFIFDWDHPTYEFFTDKTKIEFLESVRERQKTWVIGTNRQIEGFEKYLSSYSHLNNRDEVIYTYHNGNDRQVVVPEQKLEPVLTPRLAQGQEIGNHMSLAILTGGEFSTLRSQYMNKRIKPGAATLAVGVLVDGFLVGVFAYTVAPSVASAVDISQVYMLSDFPVVPTDYPKLAKLVLVASLSQEAKFLAERIANRRIRSVKTTAFTDRHVSMKYRGLFKLHSKKENEDGKHDFQGKRFMLNYVAKMGDWSLNEGLAIWKKRYGERIE